MKEDTTVVPFRHSDCVDDPLTALVREGARRMMMQMLGSFAEFERAIVRERTMAGLQAARERGRKGGRRPKLTSDQRSEIIGMLNDGRPAAEIARLFRVHRSTIGRISAETRVSVP